ncbi:MAG TPA: hypothetical protein VLA90_01115 [Actinomycetota bacterium]|nr:hypothetical protein [Actinomycetota bacterium]
MGKSGRPSGTAEDLGALRDTGIRHAPGFHLGDPLPLPEPDAAGGFARAV